MARDKIDIGSKEIYDAYLKSLDSIEKNGGYKIPRYKLNNAVHEVNRILMEKMLMENQFIVLPYGLGVLSLFKYKPEVYFKKNGELSLPKDIPATYELWNNDPEAKAKRKFVYHRNLHTGGYVIRTNWEKNGVKVKNISGYRFKPVKDFKRMVTKALKDPLTKVDFFEVDKKKRYNGK